ncbi:hypothetical protein GJAV_G00044830 [Gymnothorax javanicus]|nr:hypothetical protein GJAV_G00044830 [Gymnothorax javanicus]
MKLNPLIPQGAMSQEQTQEGVTVESEGEMTEEAFLKELYAFMKRRDTPIERIPHLGFKQIDLFLMFKTVQSLGGYNQVTAHQAWKQVYNKLGGNPRSTSAATCTRRHYEKLVLPYECFLRGEDKKRLTLPQHLKRSRSSSFPIGEEEGLHGGKRSAAYGHMHSTYQNSHEFFEDRVRVIPVPAYLQHYCHPSSAALAPYLPTSHTMSKALPHPDPRTSYFPSPLEVRERPLAVLRTLANEYMSSAGWAEPLNLSCKEGGIGKVSQQPSSFTPTSSTKTPKFLNKVVPLYRAGGAAKDEGTEISDTEVATAQSSPASLSTCTLPALSRHVSDLTSSEISCNSAPVTDPTTQTEAFSATTLWHHDPSSPVSLTAKVQKTDPQSEKGGEFPKPSESPLNLSNTMMSNSSGRMEIQIPLSLLQDWFKGNFVSGFHNCANTAALQSGETLMEREARSPPARDTPSDLSLHQHQRNRIICNKGEDRNFSSFYTKERHTVKEDIYTGISHHHHPVSPERWESKTDCRGYFVPCQRNLISKDVSSSNTSHFYIQNREYAARKSLPKGPMEAKDLAMGRNRSQVQATPITSAFDSYGQEHGGSGPLSLTYRCEKSQSAASPTLFGPPEKARPMTGPPSVVFVNPTSSSLQTLTQEEYLKLRQLISSSL